MFGGHYIDNIGAAFDFDPRFKCRLAQRGRNRLRIVGRGEHAAIALHFEGDSLGFKPLPSVELGKSLAAEGAEELLPPSGVMCYKLARARLDGVHHVTSAASTRKDLAEGLRGLFKAQHIGATACSGDGGEVPRGAAAAHDDSFHKSSALPAKSYPCTKVRFFGRLRGWIFSERTKKPIGTWDKEDKDGKENEHTGGAKLVTGDARVTRMAKKTKPICEERRRLIRPNHLRLVVASYAARIECGYRRCSNHKYGKQYRVYMRLDKKEHPASASAHPPAAAGLRSPPIF